jgi:acyl-CoA synthetase (AMP-forming)/AMP-acid ligase II
MDLLSVLDKWRGHNQAVAIVCDDLPHSYAQLHEDTCAWRDSFVSVGITPGMSVAITGTLTHEMIALLFALIVNGNVIVPFLSAAGLDRDEAMDTARVEAIIDFGPTGAWTVTRRAAASEHPLLASLRDGEPTAGLILFTSGSTGKNKASLHRMDRLIDKVLDRAAQPYRSLVFLMFDHIGGMNTLLYALLHGGTAVFVHDRSADSICRTIEHHRVQVLPTTPTFLNMLLLAGASSDHDLSSLELVTYGTEPMLPATLSALNRALPGVRCKQTYGLTEAGILPTRSETDGSVWMKVGGAGFETRIVDGVLWLRTRTAMLGYLNAPSPFDEEGWLNTGDRVEVRGDYLRVLGRDSEVISVGGEKLYPADVENVILSLPNIADVLVSARSNAIVGQVVVATVRLVEPEDATQIERRVRAHCKAVLPAYKVPAVVLVSATSLAGGRFKKIRKSPSQVEPGMDASHVV